MPKKFSEHMATFSPCACRLLARTDNARGNAQRPLTDREIADRSGLALDEVRSLTWAKTWDNVPAPKMIAFSRGCGLDFDNRADGGDPPMRKHLRLLERLTGRWETAGHYLRRDPEWETKWKPLIEHLTNG